MASRKLHHGLLQAPLVILALLVASWTASSVNIISKAEAADTVKTAETGDTIALEIGKAQLIRLTTTPDVVMLGNPAVADVVLEDNGLLFLLGREPGETNLLILNKAGKVILSSSVIVVPLSKRRVTVDRGPEVFTLSCDPRCVPVATPQGSGATTAATAPADQTQSGEGGSGGADAAAIANAASGLTGSQPASQ
ncbi:MAG: pilus assembly protein N-terminal domain-containing protein [Alphaproteobacteria bacterium]|nr:pilus assembly protein N-terminal domain-containing protein [Alphaproteobacteria bacterium]MBL6954412.1 pilus assembly protein N-terminal domain-containing protein [Alphaproteobacteria bacterium]